MLHSNLFTRQDIKQKLEWMKGWKLAETFGQCNVTILAKIPFYPYYPGSNYASPDDSPRPLGASTRAVASRGPCVRRGPNRKHLWLLHVWIPDGRRRELGQRVLLLRMFRDLVVHFLGKFAFDVCFFKNSSIYCDDNSNIVLRFNNVTA